MPTAPAAACRAGSWAAALRPPQPIPIRNCDAISPVWTCPTRHRPPPRPPSRAWPKIGQPAAGADQALRWSRRPFGQLRMKRDPLLRLLVESSSSASIARHCRAAPSSSLPPGANVPSPPRTLSPHPRAPFTPHTTLPIDSALHAARNCAPRRTFGRSLLPAAKGGVLLWPRSCPGHRSIISSFASTTRHTGEDGGDRGAVQDALGGRHPGK